MSEYLGEMNEDVIKDNFVIVYEVCFLKGSSSLFVTEALLIVGLT